MKTRNKVKYLYDPAAGRLSITINGKPSGGFTGAAAERQLERLLDTGIEIEITANGLNMKTTLKEERAGNQKNIAATVSKLLELSDAELNTLMFDGACSYMEKTCNIPEVVHEFLTEHIFWSWWKQQWALIDEVFMHQAAQSPLTLPTLRNWYKKMHREIDSYPDQIIWDQIHENYRKMAMAIIEKNTAL